jgi:hypothetical protein
VAVDDRAVLLEAAGAVRKGESFEKALGRVTRRRGGTFADYQRLIEAVREAAEASGRSLPQAAREVASSSTAVRTKE